jgi:hypothetical protein
MKRNFDLFMRGLTGFKRWKHKLFWIYITVFLFSKSKETGEGEARGCGCSGMGAGALVRVSGEEEGESYSVRELGLASGERREFIIFYLYRHKLFFEPVRFGPGQPVPAL